MAKFIEEYVPGQTKVDVWHYVQIPGGKREIQLFHRGIVVSKTTSMVRVFNPNKGSNDVSPESSELFPIDSKEVWCDITSQDGRFSIPPRLR